MSAALAAAVCSFALSVQAATPGSGTVGPSQTVLEFSSGPNAASNAAADCSLPPGCDEIELTVDVPAGFTATHPEARIRVELTWSTDVDYDLQAFENDVQIATAGATGSPEVMELSSTQDGIRTITVYVVPFAVTGGTAQGVITFIPGPEGTGSGGPITPTVPNPVAPGIPRYQVYAPPESLSGDTGEPSVGYNPSTKQAFVLSGLRTLWATFPSERSPALPLSCDAEWEQRDFAGNTLNTLDPIGVTDSLVRGHETGRTWIGHLQGKAHITAYTDDDGATWTPTEGNAPVVTGFDHQGIGVGPYPATGPGSMIPHPLYPNAFYYCGQDVAYANCTRSDDGGLTFNPPVQMYQIAGSEELGTIGCGGLHGHPRVAADGTVYVPNPSCGGKTGVAVSSDAGLSWTVRPVEGSTASGWDPQVALHTDSSAFLCYADGLNAAYGTFSQDKGATWSTPTRLGADIGIQHVAFPQAVAGTPGRATCGYLGTRTKGNPTSADFAGVWHLYFSTTYDGGRTWVTINATPDDPVQGAGGIWDGGGANFNRNLLDFNEMSIDENGYPMYGYADGCIGSCNRDPSANTFSASPRIARQIAGMPLYDDVQIAAEPRAAGQACLAGTRSAQEATLNWRVPEHGGTAITGYKIFRGTASGALTQVGETGPKPLFRDLAVDPNVPDYYYTVKAVNAAGESLFSNEIKLTLDDAPPVPESLCVPPGITIAIDGAGDSKAAANTDILAFGVSEPDDMPGQLLMQMKVASLSPVAPGVMYTARFHTPSQPVGLPDDSFIGMVQDGPTPQFVYGKVAITDLVQTTATVYTVEGMLPGSTMSADGTINFVVPREAFGLNTGDQLSNFIVNAHAGAASRGSHTQRSQTVLDDVVGVINYRLREDGFCVPNTAPVARLVLSDSTPRAGKKVTLDGRGSTDGEDAITEYYFDFGDGSPAVTTDQPVVEHVYATEGLFRATLKVKDARGLENENVAQQNLEIGKGGGAGGEQGRFGGTAGLALLLPFAALALRRRGRR